MVALTFMIKMESFVTNYLDERKKVLLDAQSKKNGGQPTGVPGDGPQRRSTWINGGTGLAHGGDGSSGGDGGGGGVQFGNQSENGELAGWWL